MKKFKAWAVVDERARVINTNEWFGRPYLVFRKKSLANWWCEEHDKVVQVEIREVKSKMRGKR